MAQTTLSIYFMSIHGIIQDEDTFVKSELEIMNILFDNYYKVDIARDFINVIQEEVNIFNTIKC